MTLAEILIAAALLSLGILPVALTFSTAVRETRMDRMELEAAFRAAEVLEQVRAVVAGRVGVPQATQLPRDNPFPEFPDWVDLDERLAKEGLGFPLMDATQLHAESSRMYLAASRPHLRRYLQVMRAPLRLGDADVRSPYLLEVRVKVDYGRDLSDPKSTRSFVLDTLISHEEVLLPR